MKGKIYDGEVIFKLSRIHKRKTEETSFRMNQVIFTAFDDKIVQTDYFLERSAKRMPPHLQNWDVVSIEMGEARYIGLTNYEIND